MAAEEQTGWRFSEEPSATLAYADSNVAAFEAVCEAEKIGPEIPVALALDTGGQDDGVSVDVVFASDTFDATYVGKVRERRVQLPAGIDDPLWKILRTNETLSFKVEDGTPTAVQLDGAAAVTTPFLRTCRAQFAAADAAVPETDMTAESFVCEDGTKFQAVFDNSRSYSIALLTVDGESEVVLIQGPSGSGVRYSNGDDTLHTKGDDALLMRGVEIRRCHVK